MITDDMRAIIASSSLSYVATVNSDGTPNLSPKGSLAVWDSSHLYFADIASPATIANLEERPGIEVNTVDVFKRRGYRFKGSGRVESSGDLFDRAAEVLRNTHGPAYPCDHAVLIEVESVAELLSPAYMFGDPRPAESEVERAWLDRLGVARVSSSGDPGE